MLKNLSFLVLTSALLLSPLVHAEEMPSQPIDQDAFRKNADLQETKLMSDGKLFPLSKLFKEKVSTDAVVFAPAATARLETADLRDKLLRSTLVVGLYYKCHDCNSMHFEMGSGFAIAAGGIVSTCAHMMELQPKRMLEAYPVAIDYSGKVYPIDRILAYDELADTCLVHVQGGDFPPLGVRPTARAGESIYCLSHPGENLFTFTSGMISRFVQINPNKHPVLTVDVSCEYSPGSSGGPITDVYGNVIAQVDKIFPQLLFNNDNETGPAATVYNRHMACDVREIIKLGDPAKRLAFPSQPTPEPKKPKKSSGKDKEKEPVDPQGKADADQPKTEKAYFVVDTDYDIVLAPSDFDLTSQAKSFADLYKLSADEKKNHLVAWGSDATAFNKQQYNNDPIGFTASTGYYRMPGTEGPINNDNTVSRGVDFKLSYQNLADSTVGVHLVVNDNRASEKAADNIYKLDLTLPREGFQLVKLGPPLDGKQAWLALQINKIEESVLPPPKVAPVKMLPDNKIDFQFTAADGSEVNTAKMRGKVILVDFWATWCGPCIEALPRLEELYGKYHERGFEIIGINLDEKREAMDAFLKTHKHPWPQSISAPLGKNPLADRLEFQSIPTFILIDKTGVYSAIEARADDTEAKIEALLSK